MTDHWEVAGHDRRVAERAQELARVERASWEKRAEYLRASGLPVPSFQPTAAAAQPLARASVSDPAQIDADRGRVALAAWQKRAEYLRANGLPVPPYQPPRATQGSTSNDYQRPPNTWQPQHAVYEPAPGVGLIVVITLFFGLFGLIPASTRSHRAQMAGHPTTPYWKAFWITALAPLAFWLIVAISIGSSTTGSSGY